MVTGLSSAGGNGVQQGGQNKVMIVVTHNAMSPNSVNSDVQKRAANDHRRSNKPIMEKRRRARINSCLNELKALILDAMKKDPARHSKLEKADILEMTVKHLESLQRQRAASEPSATDKFRAGFRECASEVGRFPGIEPAAKRRLLQHLASCVPAAPAPLALTEGLQLVPARLPNGDIALVPIPSRTASTASASSGSTPPPCYSPVSPADWSAASSRAGVSPCSSAASSPRPCRSPEPLELVVRADKSFRLPADDETPWRPW